MTDLVFQHDFDRAHRTAAMSDLVALVSRRSNRLAPYRAARMGSVWTVSYRGVRSVPIDRIVGSVDRVDDFDRGFRPRKRHIAGRWQRVARAYTDGRDLPPVQLFEVGGYYYVEDGHHRISVARAYGQQFIDAEITATATSGTSGAAVPTRPNLGPRLASQLRSLFAALAHPWRPATPAPAGVLTQRSRCNGPAACAA
jgi:hypothetical protein